MEIILFLWNFEVPSLDLLHQERQKDDRDQTFIDVSVVNFWLLQQKPLVFDFWLLKRQLVNFDYLGPNHRCSLMVYQISKIFLK